MYICIKIKEKLKIVYRLKLYASGGTVSTAIGLYPMRELFPYDIGVARRLLRSVFVAVYQHRRARGGVRQ